MKSNLPAVIRFLSILLPLALQTASADYSVPLLPANIAPTSIKASGGTVRVEGQPRMTKGHPCTVWDQEDIQHFRDMLKTSTELQAQLAELKAAMDLRISQPLDIPPPQKGPDGKWLFPGEYFPAYPETPNDDASTRFRRRIMANSREISDLATVYALTGDEKYGEYCKKMLLAYSCFLQYGQPPRYTLRSALGMVTQLLEESLLISRLARAYDLVYNLPSWNAAERQQIHDELLRPIADACLYPAAVDINPETGGGFASQANNRGCIANTGILMAGYATDDQELVNAALYGIKPTQKTPPKEALNKFPPPKDWTACTADNPNGGLLATLFGKCIAPDGMWIEGSPSYAFYVLGCLITSAETLWHHGIDMYRYDNGSLKSMFDFPLLLAYPDMTLPGLNDARRDRITNGTAPLLYEYAYRRYRDPNYLPIIKSRITTQAQLNAFNGATTGVWGAKTKPLEEGEEPPPDLLPSPASFKTLHVSYVGGAPTSILYDLDPNEKGRDFQQSNVNFFSVGYGILRTPGAGGANNLLLSYGPSASHGHPDKLAIDLFAYNEPLMPTPGVIFPYNNALNNKWFHTTLGHSTLTVDEKSQMYFGEMYKYPKGTPVPHADQLVYGPASTMGLQRAWTDTVYKEVTMDRALFLTPQYMADLFGAHSSAAHKFDLAWHIRGVATSDLPLDTMTFPSPVPDGYNVLNNVRHAASDKAWSVTLTRGNHVARLLGAAAAGTEVIVGDGGRYMDSTVADRNKLDQPPTVIVRRADANSALFANIVDLSDTKEGYVKSVVQEGGMDKDYALLKIETVRGNDYCFAAYRPGSYRTGDIETDGIQALVMMDGKNVQALYLGGGTVLRAAGTVIQRGEAGLAYVEKTPSGTYIAGNPSPTDAQLTVQLPALAGMEVFELDADGKRGAAAKTRTGPGNGILLQLKASSKVEFVPKNAPAPTSG